MVPLGGQLRESDALIALAGPFVYLAAGATYHFGLCVGAENREVQRGCKTIRNDEMVKLAIIWGCYLVLRECRK